VPSFRDRRRLRIDARLGPGIAWLPLHEWDPTLRLPVLAPGHYELETRASVDGMTWSAGPRAAFRVRPPWYQRWWARLGAMALAVGAGVLLYRVRVGFGLRLQEQRARIARDLHDELGSGLGSIGIVAAVAGGDGLSEPERRRLTATIADTATDLGNALSDIVWSLRPGPSSLRDLCHYLAHRAGLLFPGSLPTLTIDFPSEWPEQELSLLLRRDILLIGVEALRNAARHSEADRVLLRVAPAEGTWWTLVVEDNGRGFAPLAPRGDSGVHGLDNMQRRADEIHGQLVIGAAESGGTRVALRFRLEGSLVRPRSRHGRTRLAGS
jgi:signal transduction histidine kinase